jgi:hypothetical protein
MISTLLTAIPDRDDDSAFDATDVERPVAEEAVEHTGVRTPDEPGEVVEHEEQADGHDHQLQRRGRGVAGGLHGQALHQRTGEEARRHADQHRQQEGHPGVVALPDDERGDHRRLAHGEVQEPGRPVDDHQAHGDHRVDRPVGQTDHAVPEEVGHTEPPR